MREFWAMNTWAPIFASIVDSSLWDEDDAVCKVFITILAKKEMDQVYRGTAYRLGKQTGKTEEEIERVLKILCNPDKRRREAQEFDGRRLRKVEGGWLVLNGEKYERLMREEMERLRWRKAQAKAREKKKAGGWQAPMGTTAKERAFCKEQSDRENQEPGEKEASDNYANQTNGEVFTKEDHPNDGEFGPLDS